MKKFYNGRQLANLKILWLLLKVILKHKDLRFGQIMALPVKDQDLFYMESVDILERLKRRYAKEEQK